MIRIFFLLLGIVLCATSCIEDVMNVHIINESVNIQQDKITDHYDIKYKVTLDDINNYIHFKQLKDKNQEVEVYDIKPIYSDDGILTMYIIQYNDGWEIISADKRSQMILASSDTGKLPSLNEAPMSLYLNMTTEDIKNFIYSQNETFKCTKIVSDQYSKNIEYWDALTGSNEFIELYKISPDTPLDSTLIDSQKGHWELVNVEYENIIDTVINHLIPFAWHQDAPYNTFCPYKTDEPSDKAPTGCVAISGAQTLAYLQYIFDINIPVPSTITMVGNVDSHQVLFSNYGTSLWSNIFNSSTNAAKLISYVGYLVEMDYGNNGSSAKTEDLKSKVFEQMGISCLYGDYDATIVKENLLDGFPVIVSARYKMINGGHSFIIDGYKSYRTKYIYTYEWVYDIPPEDSQNFMCPEVEVSYSSPYIEHIKINWGWRSSDNDSWYTPTEDWGVTINNTQEEFKYRKKMIYGFSKQ